MQIRHGLGQRSSEAADLCAAVGPSSEIDGFTVFNAGAGDGYRDGQSGEVVAAVGRAVRFLDHFGANGLTQGIKFVSHPMEGGVI